MSEEIGLRKVWYNNTFRVDRGKLKGRMLLEGPALGHGLIYYWDPSNVQHLVSGDLACEPLVRLKIDRRNNCIWNPGNLTKVRNVGTNSIELLRVAPKYQKQFIKDLPKDTLAAATTLLVKGNWPEPFKKGVQIDLRAIGMLAVPLSRDIKPTQGEVLRATAAQRDFEFKLEWLIRSFGRFGKPLNFLRVFGWHGEGGEDDQFLSKRKEPPYDTSVRVTANTRDESGTKAVSGCEVFAKLIGYGDDYSNPQRFPDFSTPTVDIMHVGIYNMWTRQQGVIGERSEIRIGLAGQKSQNVGLYAPKL